MLDDHVTKVKGVGPKFAEELANIQIHTVEDLLNYFPYRYDSYDIKPLSECRHQDQVTIVGEVIRAPSLTFHGKRKSRMTFLIEVEQIAVQAVVFNRAFLKDRIQIGDIYTLTGKWDAHRLQITVHYAKKGYPNHDMTLQPIYSTKGNVTSQRIKKIIQTALTQYKDHIEEFLPQHILQAYKLPNRAQAYLAMHRPKNRFELKHAKRRFTYEELLLFQLKLQLLKRERREATVGQPHVYKVDLVTQFIDSLPFTLTGAQQRVVHEILTDLKSPYQMNRLLQGDVGSGKTAVAAVCLYAAVTAGKQGALMVPTEILAEQHYETLCSLFRDQANIVLLTGSVKGKKRHDILQQLQDHNVNIVVGTHALIQDDVQFADLGLVIIDEQHRFGVEQRRILREKGLHPDVLFMTATPIPRTLAITAFGDMDVSVINEMPANRKQVETYWVKDHMFERVLNFIQKRVSQGEQAYIICPLIEESDKLDIQDAVDLYHQLQQYYQSEVKVGLMHGRLHPDEKDAVMRQFANNEVQVLVSTTVVEVGVNVPNATIMVIYDAQRFGLSQLHQLRGRVGRGDKQSYCILIADPKTDDGKERMRIMTRTTNGFELSEYDLKLRGPGDFFGTKQSGLPEFKVADIVHDFRALETARKDAADIIENHLLELDERYHALHAYLKKTYVRETLD